MITHIHRLCIVVMLAAAAQASEAMQVLFIGNSLTYTNDLPSMIAELAKAGHQGVFSHAAETPGGCSFAKHWATGKALKLIDSRQWDYVVLQDYSNNPLVKPQEMREYGLKFNDEIVRRGMKTAWYMTWSYVDEQPKQPLITKAYTDLSAETKGTLIPVGLAWDAYRTAHPEVNLYIDKKHPVPAGTYIAACVFYGVFYKTSPIGLPGAPAKLDEVHAREIQEIAWKAVTSMFP